MLQGADWPLSGPDSGNKGLRRGASLGFRQNGLTGLSRVGIAGSISAIKNRNKPAGSLQRLHAPYDVHVHDIRGAQSFKLA